MLTDSDLSVIRTILQGALDGVEILIRLQGMSRNVSEECHSTSESSVFVSELIEIYNRHDFDITRRHREAMKL